MMHFEGGVVSAHGRTLNSEHELNCTQLLNNIPVLAPGSPSCRSVQSDIMAPEEDDALLVLIYQHLKVSGYKKAAKMLEKHVSQVKFG